MKTKDYLITIGVLLGIVGVLTLAEMSSAEGTTPASATTSLEVLNPEELLKQIEAKADIVLLDARSAEEYAKAHIKGTLHYAGIEVEGLDLPHSRPIVIYCDCNGEDSSTYLAMRLIKNGYNPENIFVLRGGWYKWLELGYPVDKGN